MKQVVIRRGKVLVEDVPEPIVSEGGILIKVMYSAISAGTELMGIKEGKKSLIRKALQQPEKVKKALDMVREEGIERVWNMLKGKLAIGEFPGYSVSGIVVGVGKGCEEFKVGDRVAASGSGIASHAEFVDVPKNLVVKIPNNVSFKEAATMTLGAISMQGVRRLDPKIGEFVVVFGLGILGQITSKILLKNGVRVIGIDIDDRKLNIAERNGLELVINSNKEDPVSKVMHYTNGYGADGVIFTASTSSSKPLSDAFNMTRKKGKVVLVGVSGMEIKREDIYPKEIDFLISTSYGPGRYDENYEKKGLDYPYHYVRWTERRNMESYLNLLSKGMNIDDIVNYVFPIDKADEAYSIIEKEKPLIVLLEYDKEVPKSIEEYVYGFKRKVYINKIITLDKDKLNIAIIGAGNFMNAVHLPNMIKMKDKYNVYAVCGKNGAKTKEMARRWEANVATTDINDVLTDDNVDAVFIGTRHNLHAELVLRSLNAGKHVFVEKPLAIKREEIDKIEEFFNNNEETPVLMVGFNRRFSPFAKEIKKWTDKRINPLFMVYRMNAGYLPKDHWVHTEEGGGRIIGEGCHIIDLFNYFTESNVMEVSSIPITPNTESVFSSDNRAITLKYSDGSVGVLYYVSIGNRKYPKEHLEIFFDEKTIVMDNYKKLESYGFKIHNISLHSPDKGHYNELLEFFKGVKEGYFPIRLEDLLETSRISILVSK